MPHVDEASAFAVHCMGYVELVPARALRWSSLHGFCISKRKCISEFDLVKAKAVLFEREFAEPVGCAWVLRLIYCTQCLFGERILYCFYVVLQFGLVGSAGLVYDVSVLIGVRRVIVLHHHECYQRSIHCA